MFNRVLIRQSKYLGKLNKMTGTFIPLATKNALYTKSNLINTNNRYFSKDNKEEQKSTEKNEEKASEKDLDDDEHQEFHHDEAYDEDNKANFSTAHKILMGFGKAAKYSFWTY
jgi:hypothetical protein